MNPAAFQDRAERFALAARLAAYPAEEPLPDWARSVPALERYGSCAFEDLASDYLASFEIGGGAEFLALTGFLRDRPFAWGEELGRLAGFYRAFGVEATRGERPDHLAVELEFYAFLLAKELCLEQQGDDEGVAIVRQARQSFLSDAVGPLALGVAQRPLVAQHAIFGPVFQWIAEEVEREARQEGLAIAPLEWRPGAEEGERFDCAGVDGGACTDAAATRA